ncbi:uncharacterized protein LOC135884987 isoform X3 [Emys orbicularis]|uniref:uncharacterized protein LOC135884987 isoform X3 n=1 Tax=Emys orbicularis TaxID=82168 RepID=UPI0031FC0B10
MRFRFCGDLDCPDWVLAEISTLAKISSVKLKLICGQVLKDLQGEGIDYEKILKLTSDAKFGQTGQSRPDGTMIVRGCEGHYCRAQLHPLQCSQTQRRQRLSVQRAATAGAAQRTCHRIVQVLRGETEPPAGQPEDTQPEIEPSGLCVLEGGSHAQLQRAPAGQ